MTITQEDAVAREAWLSERRSRLTASDAAAVLGVDPFRSAYQVWAEKVGLEGPRPETEAMAFGRRMEPVVAEEYALRTGRAIVDHGRYSLIRRGDLLAATLDREIVGDPKGRAALEIKTTGAKFASSWEEEPPLRVQVQLQVQLWCAGDWPWGSVAVLIGGNELRWMDLSRNRGFAERIEEFACGWWDRHVKRGEPPPVDGSDATRDLLRRMFPNSVEGKVIPLGPEFVPLDEERQRLREQIERATRRVAYIDNAILAVMGDAQRAVVPGGGVYTRSVVSRREYVVPEQQFVRLTRGEG